MFDVTVLQQLAKWEPQYDRIMVLPFCKATASRAGLVLTEENREKPEVGVVIAIGPGGLAPETGREVVITAQVGEIVLYGKYAGQAIDSEDAAGAPLDLFVMRDIEVLAKMRVGQYDPAQLVMHDDDPRKIHFAGLTCEHCTVATSAERLASYREAAGLFEEGKAEEGKAVLDAAEEKSALIEFERERLRRGREAREADATILSDH